MCYNRNNMKFARILKKISTVVLAGVVFAVSVENTFSVEPEKEQSIKKVLFIGSSEIDTYSNSIQIQGLKSGLGNDIKMNFQFMENHSMPDDENYTGFYNRISYYINNSDFDAFVTSGDDAFNFALQYREELFKDKPIVFVGVKDSNLIRQSNGDENITGIKDVLYFDENVLLTKNLFPERKRIFLITDNSFEGKSGAMVFNGLNMRFKGFDFIELNSDVLGSEGITERLSEAGKEDVVFFLAARGIPGSVSDEVKYVLQLCNPRDVPVLTVCYGEIGTGILGGYFNSYYDMGSLAGKIIKEIFDGVEPKYLSITSDCPARYYFDYSVMNNFSIPKNKLPPDTKYINNVDLFNSNGLVWIVLASVAALLAIIFIIANINQLKARKRLTELLKENRNV